MKTDEKSRRFEEAIRMRTELEATIKEQEEKLVKRGNQITDLVKENNFFKDSMQKIRVEYGSLDNLKATLDIWKMKDEKVGELLNELNKAMVSEILVFALT